MAPEHLVELDEVLADVRRDTHAQLVGGFPRGAEQLGAAGVDLERVQHPANPPGVCPLMRADEGLRPLEAAHARLFVPLVLEPALGPDAVRGRPVARRQVGADADVASEGHRGFVDGAQLDDRRAAVPQQLDEGEAVADVEILASSHRRHAARGALIVEEARVEEVAAARIGDEPAAGFGGGMAVQVDETGNDELARRVDPVVRGPGVAPADEHDAIVLVDQTAATQEAVAPLVVSDHIPAVDDCSHRNLSSIPASTAGSGVPRNDDSGQCITAVPSPPSGERAG